ncbi:hypothetical protein FACS1894142_4730 [Spirochaetia bacterium]|nr:hypothetical protein FACS1894142_4730 [Spirochaetia bacterium]
MGKTVKIMEGVKDAIVEIRRLSPNDGRHYFYGYYDIPAFSKGDVKHLCHRVHFSDRYPEKNDTCCLGIIDIKSGKWDKLAETGAFNFQQGCMLQWNPQNPDTEIMYNVRDGEEYRTVIHNLETGKIRTLPRAAANVSRDGKWGIAINFNRVYEFRPGYGYSGVRDRWYDIPQPKDDGIWISNMETGEEKLVLNYEEMGMLFSVDSGEKLVVNHITFSPDNNRLLFLLRTFPAANKAWLTGLGTIDRDGNNVHVMNPMSMASHYYWRDDNHLLIWASVKGIDGMYLITDQSSESVQLDPYFFSKDTHCSYSPDTKYILGDGYPDNEGFRHIYLYNTETHRGLMLLRVKSNPITDGTDLRTDLHGRWSRDGTRVSFDSTHEGDRGLYLIDLADILGKII